jgi:hypothetical protein
VDFGVVWGVDGGVDVFGVVFLVHGAECQGVGRELLEGFSCGYGKYVGVDAIEKVGVGGGELMFEVFDLFTVELERLFIFLDAFFKVLDFGLKFRIGRLDLE